MGGDGCDEDEGAGVVVGLGCLFGVDGGEGRGGEGGGLGEWKEGE